MTSLNLTLLFIFIGICLAIQEHQIIPLSREGGYYSIKPSCHVVDHKLRHVVKPSFLLSLNTDSLIISGEEKCFEFSTAKEHKIQLLGENPENKPQTTKKVITTTAIYEGELNKTKCILKRTEGPRAKVSRAYPLVDIVVTQKCSPGPGNREDTQEKTGIYGLTPGADLSVLNHHEKIESFGFAFPDSASKEYNKTHGRMILNVVFDGDVTLPKHLTTIPATKNFGFGPLHQIFFGDGIAPIDQKVNNIQFAFDFNYPYIGIPSSIYPKIIALFKEAQLECPETADRPICKYEGDIKDLPPLVFTLNNNEKSVITVDYTQYLDMTAYNEKKLFRLRILQTFTMESPDYYVKRIVTKEYENSIILGSDYMEHRFVTFDFKDKEKPVIRIFDQLDISSLPDAGKVDNEDNSDNGNGDGPNPWMIVGIVGFVVLLIICVVWCVCRRRHAQIEKLQEDMHASRDRLNSYAQIVNKK